MAPGGWNDVRTCQKYYLNMTDANKDRACQVLNELAGRKREDVG